MSVLVASGLTKSYGAAPVLNDVNVTIERGEIVALAGENGSGKSTFAKLLAGITPATAGTIEVDGKPLASGRPAQAASAGIGIVPQEVTGMPDLSVAENILMPVRHSLLSVHRRRRTKAEVRPLLERLGVSVDLDAPFRSLPSNVAVLVELARALVIKPKLLIVDETTAYLERSAADRLLDLLRAVRDDGVSVVFISHRLREVHDLADRTVVLRDGRLVGELNRAESTPDRIARMMVGREIEAHQRGSTRTGSEPRLKVENVSLTGTSEPVSLHVRPGEVVGLAGLVNSGCVRLLEHVSGARTISSGTVTVDGKPVAGGLQGALASRIVMLPGDRQKEGLLRDASMRSNIMLGAWPLHRRVSPRREAEVANRFIADFGIRPNDPEKHMRLLSGGNQQKVMLARALRREPLVLLLNEPTRGVDIGARADVYGVVANSLKNGISVLFYSTDMHEVIELSDRVLVFYDNQLTAELTGDQMTEDNISRHMGGGQ